MDGAPTMGIYSQNEGPNKANDTLITTSVGGYESERY